MSDVKTLPNGMKLSEALRIGWTKYGQYTNWNGWTNNPVNPLVATEVCAISAIGYAVLGHPASGAVDLAQLQILSETVPQHWLQDLDHSFPGWKVDVATYLVLLNDKMKLSAETIIELLEAKGN